MGTKSRADELKRWQAEGYVISDRIWAVYAQPIVEQRTDEWFEMRKHALTGSVIDSVLGNNPYQSYDECVMDKAGMPRTFTGNKATRWGTYYEDTAAAAFAEHMRCQGMECKLLQFGLVKHAEHERLAHSPDGIAIFKSRPPCLIEIKCPMYRKIIPGSIPKYYMGQVYLGCEVFGVDDAYFIQYRPANAGEDILDVTHVTMETDWLTRSLPVVEKFWADVDKWTAHGYRHHPLYSELRARELQTQEKERAQKCKRKKEHYELHLLIGPEDQEPVCEGSTVAPEGGAECVGGAVSVGAVIHSNGTVSLVLDAGQSGHIIDNKINQEQCKQCAQNA